MRFIHIADVHLDTAFAGRSEAIRSRLRRASREALARCFETAMAERVDAVLIAGDLFDGDRLSFETERFLVERLTELGESGIRVVYATGNHDPGRGGARGRLGWPPNVTVFPDTKPRTVPITGHAGYAVGYVTGAGHASSRETADLARTLTTRDTDLPQVALLHTQVLTASATEAHQPYAPSDLKWLQDAGFDYWALGHVHLRQELSSEPPIHYPGNIQGRNPRETGPKGGLLVDLRDPAKPDVEFHEFANVRWEKIAVSDLAEAESVEHLLRAVATVWDRERADDPGEVDTEWMVAVDLIGPTPLWNELRQPEEVATISRELAVQIGALEVEVRTDRIHPRAQVAHHVDRQDVLGATLRLIGDLRTGRDTLDVPPEMFAGFRRDRGSLDEYVRDLLEGASEEVLSQMLVEGGESD